MSLIKKWWTIKRQLKYVIDNWISKKRVKSDKVKVLVIIKFYTK